MCIRDRSNYDGTHTYDMYEVVVYCALCGDALNNSETYTTVTEQCSLDESGVCIDCGVKPNCRHEHTEMCIRDSFVSARLRPLLTRK